MATAKISAIKKLSEVELKEEVHKHLVNAATSTGSSWHDYYKNSAYIYIGGLDFRLSEGDIIVVFSQWGEPIDINLVRDKKTGTSRGFCFLAYEDQRSTILAVDNGNGMKLLNRTLRVDHCKYKPPPKYSKDEVDENGELKQVPYTATGPEGKGLEEFTNNNPSEDFEPKNVNLIKDQDELWDEQFQESMQIDRNRDIHKKKSKNKEHKKKKRKK